jgi:hypothetical protein
MKILHKSLITLAGIVIGISLAKLSIHSPFFTPKKPPKKEYLKYKKGDQIYYSWGGHSYLARVNYCVEYSNSLAYAIYLRSGIVLCYSTITGKLESLHYG